MPVFNLVYKEADWKHLKHMLPKQAADENRSVCSDEECNVTGVNVIFPSCFFFSHFDV